MPETGPDTDPAMENREQKNREIVAALRDAFAPLTERLTPDVAPAAIYCPGETECANDQ